MLYANDLSGRKIRAARGLDGVCPGCAEPLIPKCGLIKVHHWSHKASDCDPWYEPETDWHRHWKRLVRPECAEVVMGKHRADIVGNRGVVIELQASSIPLPDAQAREVFYPKMIWLIDARSFWDRLDIRKRDGFHSFRWKHPRSTWAYVVRPRYWDIGLNHIFEVRRIHQGTPCGGWGVWVSRDNFMNRYLSDVLA